MPEPILNQTLQNKSVSQDAINVAALDIGSNSFHLVVARIVGDSVQVLHKIKQKVRMANGLTKRSGEDLYLDQESIDRGLIALENIKEVIEGFDPKKIRIVATYTLRTAKNANEFVHRALQIFPYPIEVISGFEEARLIYAGVAHTHHEQTRRLVIDIGGGSTEFVIGESFEPHVLRSMAMGCVSYNKTFFADGYITKQRFRRAILAAGQEIESIVAIYRVLSWEHCVGTSGTMKSILSVCNGLSGNQSESFSKHELLKVQQLCCEVEHFEQLTLQGLSEERKSVFCAGLSILIAIFEAFQIEQIHISKSGLRDGVLYEMESHLQSEDICSRTVQSLCDRYHVDMQQALRVQQSANLIFEQVAEQWNINDEKYRKLLNWSALLHEIGLNINSKHYHKHSGYIVGNVDLPGFNLEQQIFLEQLLRNQRKKIQLINKHFEQFGEQSLLHITVILRLALLLNITRQDKSVNLVTVKAYGNRVLLHFKQAWFEEQAILQMDLLNELDVLENVGITLEFSGI